jgi:biopolymer transport protein ExbD
MGKDLMEFKKYSKLRASPDLTSAVDIVFLLVSFFLVTTTFIMNPGLRINLPVSKTADATPQKDIVITVLPDDRLYINDKPVSLKNLPDALKRKLAEENKDMIIIKGDKVIPYQQLISVMDAARSVGVSKINLSTEKR